MSPDTLDMAWMRYGECLKWPKLGWIKDAPQVGLGEESTMAVLCGRCPVGSACEAFVEQADITGGFWAGHFRTPTGPRLPVPTETADATGEAA